MVYLVLSTVVLLVSNAFFTFDEETLIILASFVWFDAAGGLFKTMLDAELVHKVDAVRSKFVWFLSLKRQLLVDLIKFHRVRSSVKTSIKNLNDVFLSSLVYESLSSYIVGLTSRRKFDSHTRVVNFGVAVYYDRLVRNLEKTFVLTNFSGVLVKLDSAARPQFNFARYTTAAHCSV
jgi:hypothetical protein